MGGQASRLLCCRYQLPLSIFLRVPPTQSIFFLGVHTNPFECKEYPRTVSSTNDVTIAGAYLTGDWDNRPVENDPNGAVFVISRNANRYQIWFMSNNDHIYI